MQNRRLARMKIKYSLRNLNCKSFSLVPRNLIFLVLQEGPKRATTAILQNNTVILCLCYCPQKHNNAWVPHCLHRIALTEKVPQAYISILNFEFFHYHINLSPLGFVDHSIPSLIYSINYL